MILTLEERMRPLARYRPRYKSDKKLVSDEVFQWLEDAVQYAIDDMVIDGSFMPADYIIEESHDEKTWRLFAEVRWDWMRNEALCIFAEEI